MRPKSIATVVVVLPSTPVTLSMSTLAVVSVSSVVSGSISLTAPTNVVLPTPKPPAIRIFSCLGKGASKSAEPGKHCLQDVGVGLVAVRVWHFHDHGTGVDQVGQEDLGDGGGLSEVSRDLGDRDRFPAQAKRLSVVVSQPFR